MSGVTSVKGLRELQQVLDQVPAKVERNVLRGALRAGMTVVKPVAQANIHSVSGELARGLKIGTRARGGQVTANLKTTGVHARVGHLVEYGTHAHEITPKQGKVLKIGGMFVRAVEHPGARARPFLRPALDRQARPAVVAAAEYMKTRLATKEGLDTGHIEIEGDE